VWRDRIAVAKDDDALLTIGELAEALGRPTHILRYWETRFPSLRPLQRAGGRRYYRPADVALARRIDRLLTGDGYTLDGAARALAQDEPTALPAAATLPIVRLIALRDRLSRALAETA